uniref:Uncharacterized protein n=1 Tax=Strigamia maritima TaxID=126957 RepID=T1JPI9_STRMM
MLSHVINITSCEKQISNVFHIRCLCSHAVKDSLAQLPHPKKRNIIKEKTNECIFQEKISQVWYNTYASFKYSLQRLKWYVALNKRGKPRRGDRAKKRQKFTHFLLRPVDVKKLEILYGIEYLDHIYNSALQRTSGSSEQYLWRLIILFYAAKFNILTRINYDDDDDDDANNIYYTKTHDKLLNR